MSATASDRGTKLGEPRLVVSLFPLVFGGSLVVAWLGPRAGMDPALWSFLVTVGNLAVVAGLEHVFPRFAHYLFPTLDYHYLHHARERRLQDSNFASTPLYDLLLGTFHDPTRHPVDAVGITGDPVPSGFLAQLVLPFRKLLPAGAAGGKP